MFSKNSHQSCALKSEDQSQHRQVLLARGTNRNQNTMCYRYLSVPEQANKVGILRYTYIFLIEGGQKRISNTKSRNYG